MGPGICVLLPDFNNTTHELLNKFINKIGDPFDIDLKISDWEFSIKKGSLLNRKKENQNCLFLVNIRNSVEYKDEAEKNQIISKLRMVPVGEVGISAMCNDTEDHKILALIALKCVEMFGGFIDLCRLVYPPVIRGPNPSEYVVPTIEDIRNFISNIKGEIIEIENRDDNGVKYYKHIVDHAFLSNWIKNPHFFMVK